MSSTKQHAIEKLAASWARQMERLGEVVSGPETLRVLGQEVRILRAFRDSLGNRTVFTATGYVRQYFRKELDAG